VMTEKDAVKCRNFGLRNSWFIPVTIQMEEEFHARVLDLLAKDRRGTATALRRETGMGVSDG
jgi:tetraacyldisaccharide-1-P 4'-kinase